MEGETHAPQEFGLPSARTSLSLREEEEEERRGSYEREEEIIAVSVTV